MSPPPHIKVTKPPKRFPLGRADDARPSHHLNDNKTLSGNPWPSFRFQSLFQLVSFFLSMITRNPRIPKDIKSLIPTRTPTWNAQHGNESSAKATWLGHACYFVELPTPPGAARGVRIIFDPVFSNRCSPSKWVGPTRFTGAHCEADDIPAVDAIVLLHNHYDHTDVPTLWALLGNPSSSAHMFVALNNAVYLSGALNTPIRRFHELDWWDERLLRVALISNLGSPSVNT